MNKITKRETHAIRVKFANSVQGKRIYYFGSIRSLFAHFSPDILDTTLRNLYDFHHIRRGEKVFTKTCVIERVDIIHYTNKYK